MRTSLMTTVLLVSSLSLAACGGWRDSNLNPGNWFGNSRSLPVDDGAPTEPTEAINPLIPSERVGVFKRPEAEDPSVLIANVTELQIDPTPSGAIVRATGIATRQGAYSAELRLTSTEEDAKAGTLSLAFRVIYPEDATPTGTEFSRTVHAAYSLTMDELRSVRTVRVTGRENVRESRRR